MLITDEYKEINTQLHNDKPTYGKSGHKWKNIVLDLCKHNSTFDVLDYGCGKSTLQEALPFRINQYDPAIDIYSEEPSPANIVVCTDVLEHIEPDLLDNVLSDIKEKMLLGGLLTVATRPANKILSDGRNAHLIIEDRDFWTKKITDLFNVVYVEENMTQDGEIIYIVEAQNERQV